MRRRRRKVHPKTKVNRNHQIRATELRVLDEDGKILGILKKQDALRLAEEKGKDLVEVSSNSNPPVAKIIEFGKFKYQQEKKERATKKTSNSTEVKQVRISLKIGDHDLETKLNKIRKILQSGDKVRVSMMLRGRENHHKELALLRIEDISGKINEWAEVDQAIKVAGKNISIIYKAKNNS